MRKQCEKKEIAKYSHHKDLSRKTNTEAILDGQAKNKIAFDKSYFGQLLKQQNDERKNKTKKKH